jgi:hypothetical protein
MGKKEKQIKPDFQVERDVEADEHGFASRKAAGDVCAVVNLPHKLIVVKRVERKPHEVDFRNPSENGAHLSDKEAVLQIS